MTRVYNNTSYYLKGTLARETLADALGKKFTEAARTYAVRNEADQQPLADPADLTAVGFPQLVRTDKSWFEGQPAAAKT